MAMLRKIVSPSPDGAGDYLTDLPPGQYEGICIDVLERENVERRKYQSQEFESVDLIAFEFSVKGKSGATRRVRSREMRISTHEKSALYAFLCSWCGEPPEDGLDTDTLISCTARLTVDHVTSSTNATKVYVRITAITPGAGGGKGGER